MLYAEAERPGRRSDVNKVRGLRDKRRRRERRSPGEEGRTGGGSEGAMFHAGCGVPVWSAIVLRAGAVEVSRQRVVVTRQRMVVARPCVVIGGRCVVMVVAGVRGLLSGTVVRKGRRGSQQGQADGIVAA